MQRQIMHKSNWKVSMFSKSYSKQHICIHFCVHYSDGNATLSMETLVSET